MYKRGSVNEHCHMPVSLGRKGRSHTKAVIIVKGRNQEGMVFWKSISRKRKESSMANAVAKSSTMSGTS